MGTNAPSKVKPSGRWRASHSVLLLWAGIAAGLWFFNGRWFLMAVPMALLSNVFEMLWNIFLAFLLSHGVLRVWLLPLWRLVFQETGKLGQKLEWYDAAFRQLSPGSKKLLGIRLSLVFSLSLVGYILLWYQGQFVDFLKLPSQDKPSLVLNHFFTAGLWPSLKNFALFTLLFWLALSFEGRSRLLLRMLKKIQSLRETRFFLKPLPQIPFQADSKSLTACLFTAFYDAQKKLSLKQTVHEEWVKLGEPGLKGNFMVIGPTGGGKTMAVVRPLLEQIISWQGQDPAKKASVVVYDPKAELTSIVADVARKAGRADDLLIFSLDGNLRVNPIKVENPWDGETSWKVAGWIVGAWQNYQGKSSPEPYWESQNFILMRNLLILEYFEKDRDVTLKTLAESINEAGGGCFRWSTQGKWITIQGRRVLTVLAAVDREAYLKNYAAMEFEPVDHTLITLDVRIKTSERISLAKAQYVEEREDFHLENDEELQTLLRTKAEAEITKRLLELIEKDLSTKFPKEQPTEHDFLHTAILMRAEKMRAEFCAKQAKSGRIEQYFSMIEQACKWLCESWSSNAADNRGSIVSNMQPFIQQFQTPELAYIFSPSSEEETLSFDATIRDGKILIPDFPGIKIGNGLAQGMISLIKSRWQHSVLALGNPVPRLKLQIMDEAQRIITFGDGQKAIGDFDYCELSRAFGGITWFLSQSVASLEAKAQREVEWKKVHGVVRSIICLSTNDTSTIKFMQEIAGKEVKKRTSQTVTETANSPGMDLISEKYSGQSDSLGVSYTVSESLEERLQSSDIQDADAYTGVASIYDGFKNNLCRIALRPTFWPDRHDRYELIQKAQFDPDQRRKFKKKVAFDPIKENFNITGVPHESHSQPARGSA